MNFGISFFACPAIMLLFFFLNYSSCMHWSRTLVPGYSQQSTRTYYVVRMDLDFYFSVVSDSALNSDKCSSKNSSTSKGLRP
jgi:hypothetical protein